MFDLERLSLPRLVEAHGQRWLACYRVTSNATHHHYLAVPAAPDVGASLPLPQTCSLIAVPLTERELEGVRVRKEKQEREDAEWKAKREKEKLEKLEKEKREKEKKDG